MKLIGMANNYSCSDDSSEEYDDFVVEPFRFEPSRKRKAGEEDSTSGSDLSEEAMAIGDNGDGQW